MERGIIYNIKKEYGLLIINYVENQLLDGWLQLALETYGVPWILFIEVNKEDVQEKIKLNLFYTRRNIYEKNLFNE